MVWCARATILSPYVDGIEPEWIQRVVSNAIRLALFLPPVAIYLTHIRRVEPLQFLRMRAAPVMPGALVGSSVFVGYLVLACVVEYVRRGDAFHLQLSALTSLYLWVWLLIVAVCEEVVFRGLLLQDFRAVMGFWRANVLAAILFAALHAPYWICTRGLTADVAVSLLSVALAGWMFGYVFHKSNSLWCAVLAHVANNGLSAMLKG